MLLLIPLTTSYAGIGFCWLTKDLSVCFHIMAVKVTIQKSQRGVRLGKSPPTLLCWTSGYVWGGGLHVIVKTRRLDHRNPYLWSDILCFDVWEELVFI